MKGMGLGQWEGLSCVLGQAALICSSVCVCVCVCVETSEPQARAMRGTDYKVRVGQPEVTVVTKAMRALGHSSGPGMGKVAPHHLWL